MCSKDEPWTRSGLNEDQRDLVNGNPRATRQQKRTDSGPNGPKLSDRPWRRKAKNTEKARPPWPVRWSAWLGGGPWETAWQGAKPGQKEPKQPWFATNHGRDESNHGRFGANHGRFGPDKGRDEPDNGRFGADHGRSRLDKGRFEANHGRSGLDNGRFGSNQRRDGPNHGRSGTNHG